MKKAISEECKMVLCNVITLAEKAQSIKELKEIQQHLGHTVSMIFNYQIFMKERERCNKAVQQIEQKKKEEEKQNSNEV